MVSAKTKEWGILLTGAALPFVVSNDPIVRVALLQMAPYTPPYSVAEYVMRGWRALARVGRGGGIRDKGQDLNPVMPGTYIHDAIKHLEPENVFEHVLVSDDPFRTEQAQVHMHPDMDVLVLNKKVAEKLSPGAVAFDVAHEMAHVENCDRLEAYKAYSHVSAFTQVATLAAGAHRVLVNRDVIPDAGLLNVDRPHMIATTGLFLASLFLYNSIRQGHEYAADATALRKTKDLKSALESFKPGKGGFLRNAFERLFSTHPPETDRVRALQDLHDAELRL